MTDEDSTNEAKEKAAAAIDEAIISDVFDRRLGRALDKLERVMSEIRDLRALEHASHGEPAGASTLTTLMDLLLTWCRTIQAPEQLLSETMHAVVDGVLRMRRNATADRQQASTGGGIQ